MNPKSNAAISLVSNFDKTEIKPVLYWS